MCMKASINHRLVLAAMAATLLGACGGTPQAGSPSAAAGSPSAAKPAGASAAGSAAGKPSGSPIKIGVLDDITGVGPIEGALLRINVDLMIDQTNASGGINGHPVEPVFVDPKGDAAQALQ